MQGFGFNPSNYNKKEPSADNMLESGRQTVIMIIVVKLTDLEIQQYRKSTLHKVACVRPLERQPFRSSLSSNKENRAFPLNRESVTETD